MLRLAIFVSFSYGTTHLAFVLASEASDPSAYISENSLTSVLDTVGILFWDPHRLTEIQIGRVEKQTATQI